MTTSKRRGFSLLEVIFALAVISLVAVGAASTMYQSALLNQMNAQRTRAQNAARSVIEDMLGRPPRNVYDAYNATPRFAVPGLEAAPGDPAGHAGLVVFPEVRGAVREDFADASMGMPRDLNGDGRIVGAVSDYKILPVRIVVRWRSPGGRTAEFSTLILLAER